MQNTVAKRYAEALYSVARESNLTREVLAQLEALAEVWQGQEGFRALMLSPRVEHSTKRQTLAELGEKLQFADTVKNLFDLMLDKGRIEMIPALAAEYRRLDDEAFGRARAHCKVAHPLTQEQLEQLRQKLIKIVGARDVLINVEIDQSLLAGFTVSIDGKIIDGSLMGRLQRLKRSLA